MNVMTWIVRSLAFGFLVLYECTMIPGQRFSFVNKCNVFIQLFYLELVTNVAVYSLIDSSVTLFGV